MTKRTEMALIEAARSGDHDACETLIQTHYEAIYRFAVRLTANGPQAEDLTQETFAALWKNLQRFDGRSTLATWLHRIAYNKFIDGQRARQRQDRLRAHAEPQEVQSPRETLEQQDGNQRLLEVVSQLDDDDRVYIVLHYFQNLSYREMAIVLGRPEGTVKWRTAKILKQLKQLLSSH